MVKPEEVNYGVRYMALKLQELVLYKESVLEQGPKRIYTARINLGATEAFFDKVLDFALQQGMVYKVSDDFLTIQHPEDEVSTVQLRLGEVGPI